MIDLHVHTSASDGSLSPSEIVKVAARAGLEAIAITDHESVEGTAEFLEESERFGIEALSGIEIGVRHSPGTMHLLGYFIDPFDAGLRELISRVQVGRISRIEKVVARLAEGGVGISAPEVLEEARGSSPGRPHVARLLVRRGVVASIQEAFSRYVGQGGVAYVEREKPTFEEARRAIEGAGGIVVLAHPITLGLSPDGLRHILVDLSQRGLSGVEVYYPTQHGPMRRLLLDIADELSLAVTGGSDFHGDVKSEWKIGVGAGELSIPYAVLGELKKRHHEMKQEGREAIGGERSDG